MKKNNSRESLDAFQDLVDQLSVDASVKQSKWFGVPAVKYFDKVVAGLYCDQLVVKLGKERVQELVRGGGGSIFDPSDKGRPMHDWVLLSCDASGWLDAIEEAKGFLRENN